jgi:hypothetical protein
LVIYFGKGEDVIICIEMTKDYFYSYFIKRKLKKNRNFTTISYGIRIFPTVFNKVNMYHWKESTYFICWITEINHYNKGWKLHIINIVIQQNYLKVSINFSSTDNTYPVRLDIFTRDKNQNLTCESVIFITLFTNQILKKES